jgi:hypothetical protein
LIKFNQPKEAKQLAGAGGSALNLHLFKGGVWLSIPESEQSRQPLCFTGRQQ